ncbi:MAG TPA: hypothetical protein RMH85_20370 [Polyangiaceae bacterium LLY-WYZ-15_(1-7)]|nr:hypothetical protein [Polyangiaceae bacterium LLY-WYZ-15_(1-7)]HJL10840.1 hypothetical protein [Polyangiaceae bacterium LLY-WYZ-15_(1-7)]HJL29413.1 hypothetical protein [Polyangiaceae bacterium LLY-WYZ-15_(1-7)]HJL34573.1 hypothetical protein [Polyangiaceae bacterium LLY-WYZ-15_(1-7)]
MRLPARARPVLRAGLALAWLALGACDNEGAPPPNGRLAFPAALAVSPDGSFLYVANSNFNLRYNSGSLQTYDLAVLNERIDAAGCPESQADSCGIISAEDAATRDDLEGLAIEPVSGLLRSEVRIGSYADGLEVSPDGRRVYLPVRSDANLTYVDVDPATGALDCGEGPAPAGAPYDCRDAFRRGDDEAATLRGIELPADPVGVTVGELSSVTSGGEGSFVLVAHRAGRASLFFDPRAGEGFQGPPVLVHTLSGFPEELVDVTIDPETGLGWMPSAIDQLIGRVGLAVDDQLDEIDRSFLFDAGDLFVGDVDTGSGTLGDTRAIRFDPRPGVRRAYVLSRRPRALVVIDPDDSTFELDVLDIIEVGAGPSRLAVEAFDRGEGGERALAFISTFTSQAIYVVDLDLGRLVGIVRGLGGPFELTVDAERERIYVLDFRQSVIRVIDLAPMFACLDRGEALECGGDSPDPACTAECSPVQLGVVGRPVAVEELR